MYQDGYQVWCVCVYSADQNFKKFFQLYKILTKQKAVFTTSSSKRETGLIQKKIWYAFFCCMLLLLKAPKWTVGN